MPLSSPTDSSTSSSLASLSGGTLIGAVLCARTAVPDTVLTHAESRTDAAMATPTAHARVAVPMLVTALL